MTAIRRAEARDLPTIIRFIRELAEYEKLAHEVTIDEARFAEELFGPSPVAWALMAEQEGKAVGFALCFYNFSTFLGRRGVYIEDIFVSPDQRGRGIGKALLKAIAQQALEEGCGRIEWQVLDWNTPSIALYQSLGARERSGWLTYQLAGETIEALANS